jgi:hypothetical protein
MKRVLAALTSIVSLALIVVFAMGIVSLVQSEVIPALVAGSFRIQTNSMVLNRMWKGNELYWLLAAYATLVLILAVVFVLTARFAVRGKRRQGLRLS